MTNNGKNYLLFTKKTILSFCLAMIPFFLLIFPLKGLKNRPFVIFPAYNVQNRLHATTDRHWKGKSQIEKFSIDNKVINLKYTLKKGAPFPQVFFILNIGTPRDRTIDLSHFDTISIRIREATNKRIKFYLKSYVPGISLLESNKTHTLRHNQYILQLHPDKHLYKVKLKDFVTSGWWFVDMKVDRSQLPVETFEKVVSFDMIFDIEGSDFILEQPEHIMIENIAFHSPLSVTDIVLIGGVSLYGLGWIIFLIIHLIKKREQKLPQQNPVEVFSYREMELLRIKRFIEANYFHEEISTQMMYTALGIPPARIFRIVKQKYDLTFKQLINKMRIEEAKRILKETDLRIFDIAINLGFNNVTYFNSLFKSLEGVTPSDYRKQKMQLNK